MSPQEEWQEMIENEPTEDQIISWREAIDYDDETEYYDDETEYYDDETEYYEDE